MIDWVKIRMRELLSVVRIHDWCFWCLGSGAIVGFVLGALFF